MCVFAPWKDAISVNSMVTAKCPRNPIHTGIEMLNGAWSKNHTHICSQKALALLKAKPGGFPEQHVWSVTGEDSMSFPLIIVQPLIFAL